MTMPEALEAEQLIRAGETAFGHHWKAQVIKHLGIKDTTLRGVLAGKRPCPPGWTTEILELLQERADACEKLKAELSGELYGRRPKL
ncbi:hypothetical protein E3E11_02685 [Oecophyllibacter saccharovorans]|uniref:hypothetical protein n=1 Tax=Oecophyllibacter saccharovorans TaxID=2558360 RepID=UPI00114161C3|nr:hypothetical protein [Oecophyllibacter saccharovorans]QDH14947.1 hypothetical protein E3E11_02685 [Oecophyllibacter saccharovorans]